MCGIAGFCSFDENNAASARREIAREMGRALTHRGPDDNGLWAQRRCVFAHRRLAVIDPAHGNQPMTATFPQGECALCYNGELYNTPALQQKLRALGVSLATNTDTEVVLWMCILFGAQALEQLEGIFSFAFWDERKGSLLLVRDRFGVKPLFYTVQNDALVFASEVKALFAYPGVRPRVDEEGWQELLSLSPARTPGHGVFSGVKELKAGHYILFTGKKVEETRWYTLKSEGHTHSYEDTVAQVSDLLQGAIRRQLVSDVPLATLLSGGLDSSLITAVAATEYARQGLPPLETYSFDYTDNDAYFKASAFQPDSDQIWVERMTRAFHTRHRVLTCPIPTLVEELDRAALARDLPGMGDVDSSLLWFCRQVKQNHTVVISGECSDEIFGGYPWFHRRDMLDADTFPWMMDSSPRTQILRPEVAATLNLEEYARRRCRQTIAQTPYLEGETGLERRRREVCWLNLNWFMANLLERKDRMSMACGLEVRVPFCDHHLIEYVWNIPWEMKCRNGERKQVLREAARGILPESVRLRPKSPYPKTHNPLFEHLAQQRLRAILSDPAAPIHSLVDAAALEQGLLQNAGDYGKPWFGQLMAGPQMLAWLIQLNGWMTHYALEYPCMG